MRGGVKISPQGGGQFEEQGGGTFFKKNARKQCFCAKKITTFLHHKEKMEHFLEIV